MKRFILVCVLIFCIVNVYAESAMDVYKQDGYNWQTKTQDQKWQFVSGALMFLMGTVGIVYHQFGLEDPELVELCSIIYLNVDTDEAVRKIDEYYKNGNRSNRIFDVLLHVYGRCKFTVNEL